MMGGRAHGVKQLHQPLKRRILVFIGRQRFRPHLSQQLGEAAVASGIHPQHPGIDEKPDQIGQRRIHTPSDRTPNADVITSAQLAQQHR
ncbi:hypothetical protein MSIMFI_05442 [Mycobacterium simulans]|nr:hypothetical protein MSIMFI_05442 [Mycobacterium simulans]